MINNYIVKILIYFVKESRNKKKDRICKSYLRSVLAYGAM